MQATQAVPYDEHAVDLHFEELRDRIPHSVAESLITNPQEDLSKRVAAAWILDERLDDLTVMELHAEMAWLQAARQKVAVEYDLAYTVMVAFADAHTYEAQDVHQLLVWTWDGLENLLASLDHSIKEMPERIEKASIAAAEEAEAVSDPYALADHDEQDVFIYRWLQRR